MKDISKIIREFEKLPYKSYESRRPKHELTENYFYLSRKLAKYMMRADAFDSHIYPERIEITGTKQNHILQFFSTGESEQNEFILEKKLLQVCFTDKDE